MAAERDIDDLPRNNGNHTPLWFLERAALTHLARASVAHGPCATPGLTPTLPALPRLRPRTPVRQTRKHGAASIPSRSSSLFVAFFIGVPTLLFSICLIQL